MARVRVAACQINTVVGDLDGNAGRILEALAEAEGAGADLAVFPELTVTGYPPEDLLGRPAFIADNQAAFARIAAASGPCAAVVGYVGTDRSGGLVNAGGALCRRPGGRSLRQAAAAQLRGLRRAAVVHPGDRAVGPYVVAGVPIGITICEDMWFAGGPMADQAGAGARLLVNLNASPYSRGRRNQRLAVLADRVAETGCTVVYVNQVGGQDELVFDGASLVMDSGGTVVASAGQFVEEVLLADLDVGPGPVVDGTPATVSTRPRRTADAPAANPVAPVLGPEAEVYEALVLGTRDYVAKNGFTDAVDRALRRDRLVAGGGRRRRRPGTGPRARGDHAVARTRARVRWPTR